MQKIISAQEDVTFHTQVIETGLGRSYKTSSISLRYFQQFFEMSYTVID
jgi:hypothetical protein